MVHDKMAYVINTINDHAFQVTTNILAVKVLRKNQLNQCTSGVILCVEQCVEGVHMNWSLFLLNQLTEDVMLI